MKVKGVKKYHDRHGVLRVYDRSTGEPIISEWGSKEFFAELDAIRGKPRIEHVGTLGAAIRHYEASPLFAGLAPRTKSDYKKCLTYLGKIENTPLAVMDKAFAAMLRDKAFNMHEFKFTNYVLTVASLVIGYAQEAGMMSDNPFYRLRRIKKPKTQPDANRPWTTHEFVSSNAAGRSYHEGRSSSYVHICDWKNERAHNAKISAQGWYINLQAR